MIVVAVRDQDGVELFLLIKGQPRGEAARINGEHFVHQNGDKLGCLALALMHAEEADMHGNGLTFRAVLRVACWIYAA